MHWLDDYRLDSGEYYLDNASTRYFPSTRFSEEAKDFETSWINPSGSSLLAGIAQTKLSSIQAFFAGELGVGQNEILFHSGSTEGINQILWSAFFSNSCRHFIYDEYDHAATIQTLKFLETLGATISVLPRDPDYSIDFKSLESLLRETKGCCLVLSWVNSETGWKSPWPQICDLCDTFGAKVVCDGTQGFGKWGFDLGSLKVNAFVCSAHKIGGPVGVGLTAFRDFNMAPLLHGGGQQANLRSGTVNVIGILRMKACYDQFMAQWKQTEISIIDLQMIGCSSDVIQSNLTRSSSGIQVLEIGIGVEEFTRKYPSIIFGTGSACSSGVFGKSSTYKKIWPNKEVIRLSI